MGFPFYRPRRFPWSVNSPIVFRRSYLTGPKLAYFLYHIFVLIAAYGGHGGEKPNESCLKGVRRKSPRTTIKRQSTPWYQSYTLGSAKESITKQPNEVGLKKVGRKSSRGAVNDRSPTGAFVAPRTRR